MHCHYETFVTFASIVLLLITATESEVVLQQQSTHLTDVAPCPASLSVRISHPVALLNGNLLDGARNLTYPPGKWYVSDSVGHAYVGCPCGLFKPCLRKCCPLGHSYRLGREKGCERTERDFRVIVASDDPHGYPPVSLRDGYFFLFGMPCKGRDYRLRPEYYSDNAYYVRPDGTLFLPNSGVGDLGPDGYCFEQDPESGDEGKPYVCLDRLGVVHDLSAYGFPFWRILPMVFLLYSTLTCVIPRQSGKLTTTEKNGTYMLICLLIGRISYVLVTIISNRETKMDTFSLALTVQFFLLTSAFWFNIMCLDAFLLTRDPRSPWGDIAATGLAKTSGLKRRNAIVRTIYALGWPFIITITSGLTSHLPDIPHNQLNPKNSLSYIWFKANSIAQGCLLGSEAVLLSCNLLLCLITATTLFTTWSKVDATTTESERTKKIKTRDPASAGKSFQRR
ncbi:uncharacterized protein [Hetaerina americana]|uniref:uncharacterized protein isoform X2 n=1 Tax=Hetaerina americana TaxID=62018 RepID=UPI003A7F5322